MFICDNQFAPPTHLNRFPPEYEKTRLQVDSLGSMVDTRSKVGQFFKNEAFTIAPGDGSLSGVDALLELAQTTNTSISVPILVLHSGISSSCPGILVSLLFESP